MYVKIWAPPLDFGSDFEICCSRQVGMDAALHAHLGGAGVPGFGGAVADLLQRQRVRVGVGPALRERAEPAAGVADVGEVDVAGDDVGHVVALHLAAQRVGQAGQRLELGSVRGQQGDGLVVGEGGRVTFGLPERGGDLAGGQHGRGAGNGRGAGTAGMPGRGDGAEARNPVRSAISSQSP